MDIGTDWKPPKKKSKKNKNIQTNEETLERRTSPRKVSIRSYRERSRSDSTVSTISVGKELNYDEVLEIPEELGRLNEVSGYVNPSIATADGTSSSHIAEEQIGKAIKGSIKENLPIQEERVTSSSDDDKSPERKRMPTNKEGIMSEILKITDEQHEEVRKFNEKMQKHKEKMQKYKEKIQALRREFEALQEQT